MKRFLKFAGTLAAILIVAFVALSFFFDANRFRPLLEQQLSQALGRTVTIGDLSLAILSGGVSASDLAISEDPSFGSDPFLTAKSLDIGVDLGALIFSQALHVRALTVDGADVRLTQTEAGAWNFSSLGAAAAAETAAAVEPVTAPAEESAPLDMQVRLIHIAGSTVRLTMGTDRHEFHNVDFELRDFSPTSSMPFSLSAEGPGGGVVNLQGDAGPVAKPDAAATPFRAQVSIKSLDLAASGFADPASGVGGLLTVQGDVSSTGQTASMTGAVTVDQLKMSPKGTPAERPVAINLALAHDLKARRGNIARSELKLGGATATLSGSYSVAGDTPRVDVQLNGTAMPLPEVLAFLPALDVRLPQGASISGGAVDLRLAALGPMAELNTGGALKVRNATLNYDLGAKLRLIQQLADLPDGNSMEVSSLGAEFDSNTGGTAVRDIEFDAPSVGKITGEGTVSPNHELDFRMKAVVKTGGAVAAALNQRGDTTTVPFTIRGTSSDPSFSPDVKSIANEKLQQAIRNPEGAVKNAVDTAKGVLDLFRKAPPKDAEPTGATK